MIAASVTKSFPSAAVERGRELLQTGAVQGATFRKGSIGFLSARVLTDSFCAVSRIEWNRAELEYQCNCAAFRTEDRCDHLYSLLLSAEQQGLLPAAFCDGTPPAAPPPQWVYDLQRLAQDAPEDRPTITDLQPDGQLVYLLEELPETREDPGLLVYLAQMPPGGQEPRPLQIAPADLNALPDESDRRLVMMLVGASGMHDYAANQVRKDGFSIYCPAMRQMLPALCATGRAYWNDKGELHRLSWDDGEEWVAAINVAANDGAAVTAKLTRNGSGLPMSVIHLLPGGDLFLFDHAIHRVRGPVAESVIRYLQENLPIESDREHLPLLLQLLLRIPGQHELKLPENLGIKNIETACVPRLLCNIITTRSQWITEDTVAADLDFIYAQTAIPGSDTSNLYYDPQNKTIIRRDRAAEDTAKRQLYEAGIRARFVNPERKRLVISADRFRDAALELAGQGWQIEGDGLPRYVPATDISMQITSGIDWLELNGEVTFGAQSVPLPKLLQAMKAQARFVELPGGRKGVIPQAKLRAVAALAANAAAPSAQAKSGEPAAIRFTPSQAALLDALVSTVPQVTADDRFGSLSSALHEYQQITPCEPPVGFVGQLRDYQKLALGWFAFLQKYRLGGCLADDMGLGKTVQVLALLEDRRQQRHTGSLAGPRTALVVAPRSLVFNWIQEASKFTPLLKCLDYSGKSRLAANPMDYDLVVTTYGTLRRDAAELAKTRFDYVILDEAQAIKNATTATARAVRVLDATHRLALSGTPVENHLGELVSLFEFLNPGMLSSSRLLRQGNSTAFADDEFAMLLAKALRPFILRRTKQQVAKELPERTEQTILCELENGQRKEYDELREHYQRILLGEVREQGVERNRFKVLEALLRLRQAACHPGLIQPARAGESSAKLESVLEQIQEVTEEGHKALVFSQFVGMLSILRKRLDELEIPYEYLDGSTADRQARVEHFQSDPECRLFLISLKAGGVGLNLTAAEYVFLLDPWWNPAAEAQAIDRAHRIGQTRQVIAYRLIAKDTVEEKVVDLQKRKRDLADAIIGEQEGPIAALTKDDVELLLS